MKRLNIAFILMLSACAAEGGDEDPTASGGTSGDATAGPSSATAGPPSTTETSASGPSTSSSTDPSSGTTSGDDGSSDEDTGNPLPPPPGEYEGYGAVTEGANSCDQEPDVVHVTSLDDAGAGTLREAVEAGCREIVFDVGGTITLASDLNVAFSFITVNGASAPEPGITIVQPAGVGTVLEARNSVGPIHDVIVHHLRMEGAGGHDNAGDIWGLDGENHEVYNIIIDHVTATGSTDGVFDIWEDVHDVTISWNLIADTITALHLSTSGTTPRARISFHHNVFAGNNERQVRIRHDNDDIDYRNNVVYGWGWFEGGAAGLHIAYDAGETNPSLNAVANVFHHVGGLSGDEDDAIKFERGGDEGIVYFADNLLPGGEGDAMSTGDELTVPPEAQVTQYDAASLDDMVVPTVGTHYPTDSEVERLAEIADAIP